MALSAASAGVKTWADWETIHQPFELHYHLEHGIEWCRDEERFWGFWNPIFDFIGAKGKKLDVGCGPRPPFGSPSTAIDPLAGKYREVVPEWWTGVAFYPQPAESFVQRLEGDFQTVMCWNALDHTIGWKAILENLKRYGAKDATYAIATDFKPPHTGHPSFDKEEFFKELDKHFEIVKQAENFQERDVALVLRAVGDGN